MGRRLGLGLIVIVLVLLAVDRGAAWVAGNRVASALQQSRDLAQTPTVKIEGFPFLTQVLAGRFTAVTVMAHQVPTPQGLVLDTVTSRLGGIQASASDLMAGRTNDVVAGSVAAVALTSYGSLDAEMARRIASDWFTITFGPGSGENLAFTATVHTPLGSLDSTGEASIKLVPEGLQIALIPDTVTGLASLVSQRLAQAVDRTVPLPKSVSGVQLTGVRVTPQGVELTAEGTDVPLKSAGVSGS